MNANFQSRASSLPIMSAPSDQRQANQAERDSVLLEYALQFHFLQNLFVCFFLSITFMEIQSQDTCASRKTILKDFEKMRRNQINVLGVQLHLDQLTHNEVKSGVGLKCIVQCDQKRRLTYSFQNLDKIIANSSKQVAFYYEKVCTAIQDNI